MYKTAETKLLENFALCLAFKWRAAISKWLSWWTRKCSMALSYLLHLGLSILGRHWVLLLLLRLGWSLLSLSGLVIYGLLQDRKNNVKTIAIFKVPSPSVCRACWLMRMQPEWVFPSHCVQHWLQSSSVKPIWEHFCNQKSVQCSAAVLWHNSAPKNDQWFIPNCTATATATAKCTNGGFCLSSSSFTRHVLVYTWSILKCLWLQWCPSSNFCKDHLKLLLTFDPYHCIATKVCVRVNERD